MKYQFECQIQSDCFDDLTRVHLFEEFIYQAHFLRLSWIMAELSLPTKVFGLVNKSLDGIGSNNGSFQGVLCYNYLSYLAEQLQRHGVTRVYISKKDESGIIHKMSTFQFILFMREAIKDNDYCLPSGFCRQFTNAIEFCIRRVSKITGNDFDFFHMWDSADDESASSMEVDNED